MNTWPMAELKERNRFCLVIAAFTGILAREIVAAALWPLPTPGQSRHNQRQETRGSLLPDTAPTCIPSGTRTHTFGGLNRES